MTIWLFYTILAIGAVQGIVLGVLLWRSPSRRRSANRWLAVILFFIAYRLTTQILKGAGLISIHSFTYHLFLEYNWIYGALLWFYVRSYLDPAQRTDRRDWKHFLPVGLQFLFSNFVKIQNFYWDGTRESLSAAGYYGYILWMHTPLIPVVAFLLLAWYAARSLRLLGDSPGQAKWLNPLLWSFLIVGIVQPLIAVTDFLFFDYAFNPFYVYPLYITMALLLYWLGLAGFIHRHDPLSTPPDAGQREQWREVLDILTQRMERDRLFLDPQLTVDSLAEATGVKAYRISQALNRQLGKSFNDYVNEFRVAEVGRLLLAESHQHYTLLAVALEAGFNSKASFNRAVKKCKGLSPSQWRRQLTA